MLLHMPLRKSAIFLFCAIVFSASALQAQNTKAKGTKQEDFGSEQIIGDSYDPNVAPLPVELVEEQSPAAGSRDLEQNPKENRYLPTKASSSNKRLDGGAEAASEELTELLNSKDVDLGILIKAVSRITGRVYLVDKAVKGKTTVHVPEKLTLEESLRIFDAVLLMEGFSTVPMGENSWKILSAKDAKTTTIPLVLDPSGEARDTMVTELLRLKYAPAEDMQKLLTQFISPGGLINSFSGTNALILIDSAANIRRLRELVEALDVPAVDQDITVIPIAHAEAKDIADKINQILGADDKDAATATNTRQAIRPNTTRPNANARQTPRSTPEMGTTVGKRSLPIKVIPDERTNSVIVVADPELTLKVRALVEQLDSPVDLSGGRFYVYRLKHASAEDLSDILGQIISGGSNSGSSTGTESGSSSGSSLNRSKETSKTSEKSKPSSATRKGSVSSSSSDSSSGSNPVGKVNFEGDVLIAPDPSTNSLIINASRSDFLKISEVIDKLDVKRSQVIVEATILEVRLDDAEALGVEWQLTGGTDNGGMMAQTNYGGLSNLLTSPEKLSDLTLAAASSGTVTLPGGTVIPSQAVLVSALSTLKNVNVLSSPTLVTTDNQEAEIVVGENIPIVTSKSTDSSQLTNTFNQIERQDVGITLRLTPQISSGDFVSMKIFMEISNVVAGTQSNENGPTTTMRTTETTVEVRNGQMVVTGGLIGDMITDVSRGVPFLKDIPVLGHLFRTDSKQRVRTNLVMFLTPKIIRDQFDARETTVAASTDMRSIIKEQQVDPDREEVLRNRAIDDVAEPISKDMTAPTAIRPPKELTKEKNYNDAKTLPVTPSLPARDTAPMPTKAPTKKAKEKEKPLEFTASPSLPFSEPSPDRKH